MKNIKRNISILVFLLTLCLFLTQQNFASILFNENVVNLSESEFIALIKEKKEPQYPPACRCVGEVIVNLTVNKIGKVIEIEFDKGHPIFRYYISKAVKKWRFYQLKVNDKPVQFSGQVKFNYQ